MLQRLIKSPAAASVAMLFFSVLLFSFSNNMGGDSFQVYINKKLAIQQYVTMKEPVKTLQLDQSNYNDEIEVYYSHCGQTGTARIISIRDAQNKLLKEWRYQDSPGVKTSMNCSIKEVASLHKAGGNMLHLYYSSRELPEGRLLASIAVASTAKASR